MVGAWKHIVSSVLVGSFFLAAPSSSNYTLKSYDLGSGGGGDGSSSSYNLEGNIGEQSGDMQSSSTYSVRSGEAATRETNVPAAPSFTNPSNEYSRLKLVINPSNNSSAARFLVAISSDNFVTTSYVQSDNTVGSSQALSNYQTYTAWGGASGTWITGLDASTTYKVKVKAWQGNFSGSAFGPAASAATVMPTLSFSVTTTLSGSPPFGVSFASLAAGTVFNGDADILVGLTTNALNGGSVYVFGTNNGLLSSTAGATIASATADLSVASSGYGAQVTSASQTSGGPIASAAPYNGSGANVGIINTTIQTLATTPAPISGGSLATRLKAKTASTTASASDYADTITLLAAMQF